MYWTLLTLGSLLMVAAAGGDLGAVLDARRWPAWRRAASPNAGCACCLTCSSCWPSPPAYWLIPHRTVPLRFAFAGGLLATFLFELLKWGLAIYLRNASFQQLYGALAVIPIFLIWVYISWLVVLLGASLAASLASFRYQPRALAAGAGRGDLRRAAPARPVRGSARATGSACTWPTSSSASPGLTDELLQT